MFDLKLSDYDKAMYLDSARLCAAWLCHNQNTDEHPWTDMIPTKFSADNGRFMEKVVLSRGYCRSAGVWLNGIYLCGLYDILHTPVLDTNLYHKAIDLGAEHLKRLQCFDSRWPKAIGGFHEVYPGHDYSAPRDAASGCMGLITMYLRTGEQDYLDRALAFAEWYRTHGSDPDGFPWDDFNLAEGKGTSRLRGDWQAGGTLIYYQLWKITGDNQWRDALIKACDVLITICENDPGTDTPYNFHGDCIISKGNDDFADIALFAAYMITGEDKYKDLAARRLRDELGRQAECGAFPGYGGTPLTAIELIEALDLAEAGYEILPPEELIAPLMSAAEYCLDLQERDNHDPLLMGGVYGQTNYGTTRDVVHGRDVVYAMILFIRLAGYRSSGYSLLGWDELPEAVTRKKTTQGEDVLETG